jgi:hypothetical protein
LIPDLISGQFYYNFTVQTSDNYIIGITDISSGTTQYDVTFNLLTNNVYQTRLGTGILSGLELANAELSQANLDENTFAQSPDNEAVINNVTKTINANQMLRKIECSYIIPIEKMFTFETEKYIKTNLTTSNVLKNISRKMVESNTVITLNY